MNLLGGDLCGGVSVCLYIFVTVKLVYSVLHDNESKWGVPNKEDLSFYAFSHSLCPRLFLFRPNVPVPDGKATGMALGSLCIITGIVFLIDFLFAIKNTRFTYVQARVIA